MAIFWQMTEANFAVLLRPLVRFCDGQTSVILTGACCTRYSLYSQ